MAASDVDLPDSGRAHDQHQTAVGHDDLPEFRQSQVAKSGISAGMF